MDPQRSNHRLVAVALARPLPEPYTYAVPAWMEMPPVGSAVVVPLGHTSETGYVVEHPSSTDVPPEKLRPISRVAGSGQLFDAEQLAFFRWIADYYLASLGMVIHMALPSQVKVKVIRGLEPTEEGLEELTAGRVDEPYAGVLREVIRRPGLTKRGLRRKMASDLEPKACDRAIDALVRRGWAIWEERQLEQKVAKVQMVRRTVAPEEVARRLPRMGKRMAAVLRALAQEDEATLPVAQLRSEQGAGVRDALKRLEAAEVVERFEVEARDVLDDAPAMGASTPPLLNDDQQRALAALTGPESARPWLLFGVTGSGKTEVFLGAARHALDQGKQVCVLVPEIGLTPQLVGRFKARFGDDVAVLHSGLTPRDRQIHWDRIRSGEARVAVGARSALFAPFPNLGLIVVDEEHDDSYKQDEGVRYNARDVAVVLGTRVKAPVILASATPSLESWQNAQQGRYGLLRLPKRATPRPVPTVEIVDLTEVPKPAEGPRPLFAPQVLQALGSTLAQGGKAIVLYNRRGFATLVQCGSCGGTYECPNCGISMTLHARASVMACHYCGLRRPYDRTCPACQAPDLDELGKGTERVAEVLAEQFPGVAIGRMDADTTAVRGAHHRILDAFRRGETQLLVGTQIVAKGHDFPDVRLAVVVSADQGFRMPDFRAGERTYALLVQLAGRAGRGDVAGRVLVQTHKPDHYALQHLDDVEAFMAHELRLRTMLRYPPMARLVLLRLDGPDRRAVSRAAAALARTLRAASQGLPGTSILGPSPAALPRLVGRWRFQIVLRGGDVRALREWLRRLRPQLIGYRERGVRLAVDIDPRHLM